MARNVIPRGCALTSVKRISGGFLVGYICQGNLGERHTKTSDPITRAFTSRHELSKLYLGGYSKQHRRSRRTRRGSKRRS